MIVNIISIKNTWCNLIEDFLKSRSTHFSRAGKDMYEKMLNDPDLMSKFTDVEIEKFKEGLVQ